MKIPYFHYTYLDNLLGIIEEGRVVSRTQHTKDGRKFTDISIDPRQPARTRLGLLNYIPLFPGFYTLFRGYALNGFLMANYDQPKVQNKSFYGSFNRVLQFKKGIKYENVITFLVDDGLVYDSADHGKVRLFSDLAVKPDAREYPIANRRDLSVHLEENIDGTNISGEVDLLDDGKASIAFPSEIEAIIVDNDEVGQEVGRILGQQVRRNGRTRIFVSEHPRNAPGENLFS